MKPEAAWGPRWANCVHPLSLQYMEIAVQKRSLVVLAADLPTTEELVDLIANVGEYVAVVKTHVDAVEGFSKEGWAKVVDEARTQGVLLFEDRRHWESCANPNGGAVQRSWLGRRSNVSFRQRAGCGRWNRCGLGGSGKSGRSSSTGPDV